MSRNTWALRPAPCLVALVGAICLGCGGGAPEPKSAAPAPPASAPASPADECLADAARAHTPRSDAPERISVAHILVRHSGVKHADAPSRDRGAACLRADEARNKLLGGADWAGVVQEYSDAGGATGGDLGSVAKDDLDATFANAAFSLDVNELSHVVETERGFHVIVRTE